MVPSVCFTQVTANIEGCSGYRKARLLSEVGQRGWSAKFGHKDDAANDVNGVSQFNMADFLDVKKIFAMCED